MRKTRRHFQTPPWDLFPPLPETPTWEELPQPAKRQLTELLARLFREQHDQKAAPLGTKEVDRE